MDTCTWESFRKMQKFNNDRLMEIDTSQLSIESIYELASEIGEHFKKLIQLFGSDKFETLIPCIINVLENLENITIERNNYLLLINKLQKQIDQLNNLYEKRIKEQIQYQSDVEDIDDLWRNENNKLKQLVHYLKNENNRLNLLLSSQNQHLSDDNQQITEQSTSNPNVNEKIINNNQIIDDKIQTKISNLNDEIKIKNEENDNLKNKLLILEQENENIRKIISTLIDKVIDCDGKNYDDNDWCKEKIDKLEEKLSELHKKQLSNQSNQIDNNNIESAEEAIEHIEQQKIKMEDLPVQGPIPKEPDEKFLYSRSNNRSRIWSFFPKLTKAFIK